MNNLYFPSFTFWHKTNLLVVIKNLSKAVLWSFSDRHLKQRHPFQTIWDMAYRRVFVSSIEIWILSLSHRDPWNFGQSMKDEMREEANMPGASQVIIGNILVLQEQIDPPAWSPVQEALERDSDANHCAPVKGICWKTLCAPCRQCVFTCVRVFVGVCILCACVMQGLRREILMQIIRGWETSIEMHRASRSGWIRPGRWSLHNIRHSA